MKKILAMVLALVLCLSLCACGGTRKLTEEEITSELADCKGTLNLETRGKKVVSFTYVVEDVNANHLIDRQYTYKAMALFIAGDTAKMTLGQFKVIRPVTPLLHIDRLLAGNHKIESLDMMVNDILDIICDGSTVNYGGWKVSAVVDLDADSITIKVVS